LDVVIARAFQHAGPRQLPKFMLPEWAEQFARPGNEPIRVTTLDSHTDLSDVRDVVRAYRLLLATSRTSGIYNVGSGRSTRSGDVFQQLVAMTGRQSGVIERQPGYRQHPIADCTRLKHATGWQPAIPLERTIADTLAYFRQRV
jgi:GDP-4-dehydro-6-deoxy-D-mannose reductase